MEKSLTSLQQSGMRFHPGSSCFIARCIVTPINRNLLCLLNFTFSATHRHFFISSQQDCKGLHAKTDTLKKRSNLNYFPSFHMALPSYYHILCLMEDDLLFKGRVLPLNELIKPSANVLFLNCLNSNAF